MSDIPIRPAVQASELPRHDGRLASHSETLGPETADMFPQSVASGWPVPTGVVLWTRIDPEHHDPARPLRLKVATDKSFDNLQLQREIPAPAVRERENFTIRVDLAELLEPDSTYWYRFEHRGTQSQTGRCRTLPAKDSAIESVRLGVLNCQNYQNGYYGAMAHLAATDVDFVLHLGDYIYEGVADGYPNGAAGRYEDRQIELPSEETHPVGLEDFRHLYQTYKSDPYLQRLHERHTIIQTWDDHAIANDRYWDYDTGAPVFPDHPQGDDPEFTTELTWDGIQAWWEFLPGRIDYDNDAEELHEAFTLYQQVQFGDLVTLFLTDERLYRSRPLSTPEKLFDRWIQPDESRTMLGPEQREWFRTELRESDTVWSVWGNAVLFKPLYILLDDLSVLNDSWNGFEAERRKIIETFTTLREQGETSVVTLTGDMHVTLATLIESRTDPEAPVAAEFMTPSVTSVNPKEWATEGVSTWIEELLPGVSLPAPIRGETELDALIGQLFGQLLARGVELASGSGVVDILAESDRVPEYQLIDGANWGYSVVEFTPEYCTWDVFSVDKTENTASADREPLYRIHLPVGTYSLDRCDEELCEHERDQGDRENVTEPVVTAEADGEITDTTVDNQP